MFKQPVITRLTIGEVYRLTMPWSEVCIHLRVQGKTLPVRVQTNGAQLLNDDGTALSFPITHGEAGIYGDTEGLYTTDIKVIEPWAYSLFRGRDTAVARIGQCVRVARSMREHKLYGWRPIGAQLLAEASKIRRALMVVGA